MIDFIVDVYFDGETARDDRGVQVYDAGAMRLIVDTGGDVQFGRGHRSRQVRERVAALSILFNNII